ncbi:hypothetical protein [Aldersonia kunmingensis]|uniref:hypothetical protein n=1 Tax=Aldersonia kunmingensis TaxID=408066 RepID=UPI0008361B40|nr:hypothetical protein [Aldersonia kunmingensis]
MRYLVLYRSPTVPARDRFAAAAHRAGVLLACDTLEPAGARIAVRDGQRIAGGTGDAAPTGLVIVDVRSLAEAVEWANRLADEFVDVELTVAPIAGT